MDMDQNNHQSVPLEGEQKNTSCSANAETAEPKDPGNRMQKAAADIFEIIEMFTVCASVIMVLFTFFFHPTVVDGPSMENTLLHGDYLLISALPYEPAAGDIVVVHNVGLRHYKDPIIKRVIATEGQVIDIDFTTWTVTVDGEVVDEPYMKLASDGYITSDWSYPLQVPEGHVFVMGDNRNHSADSRSREIGLIDERCIVGEALVRVFPFARFTVFD